LRIVLVVALLLPAAGALAAQAPSEDVDQLEVALRDHRRADDAAAISKDLEQAVDLYQGIPKEEDDLRSRVVKLVGDVTRERDETVRLATFKALGTMGHEDGARFLKTWLKPRKDEHYAKLTIGAIEAAGRIADDSLVVPLLRVVDKSKNYRVAAAAMQALGCFGRCKRYRVRILEELSKTLMPDMPSRPKRGHEKDDTYIPPKNGTAGTSRWAALSPVLPGALNDLTGRTLNGIGEWLDMVDDYKNDLDVLFVDRDEEQ